MGALSLPTSAAPADVRRFVREIDGRLERLDRSILLGEWNLNIGRSQVGSAPWQLRRARLLSTPGLLEWVRSARRRSWPPQLGRRLELLERVLVDTYAEQSPPIVRLRSELQRRVVAFRPRWEGRRVNRGVVQRIVREDPDPERRRRAFASMEPLNRSLEAPFRELVELRTERARELGFRSVPEMRLRFQGLTPARLEELARTATRDVRARARRLRDGLSTSERGAGWHPWDVHYAQRRVAELPEQRFPKDGMMPRVLRAVRRWGFATDRMRFRVVFHDLPAGGLTLAPDPPEDVRILVHPQGGWSSYRVMFHEVGHAVQSASIRTPRHLLRWHENVPGFGAFHEGIGGLFEEIARDPEWLVSETGVDRPTAERFSAVQADDDLLAAAWLRVAALTEFRLYDRPGRDPMPEVLRLERELMGFEPVVPRSPVDPFFVDLPIYLPNYLLARLFHYQLRSHLIRTFGSPLWPNRSVGPWLVRNWFADGSMIDWVPHLRRVTGRPFSAAAFCDAFRAG